MTMANLPLPQRLPEPRATGQTARKDRWWVQPLLVFLGFSAFIVYSTLRAIEGQYYAAAGTEYLSPMYSPLLFESWKVAVPSGHAWFGPWPSWIPKTVFGLIPISPAFLILWAPGGFRFTCYYYRGAYYKAFWADPMNCSVGEPKARGKRYRGERWLPLTFQNIHRYFLYVAILFIGLLSYDAIISYWFHDAAGGGHGRFGIGVGSLVLTINPILLGGYTFGCHSLRHLVGGKFDQLSRRPARKKTYDCVSCLNRRHMIWAWASLFWVGFTDFYVRMVSSGAWTDFRIL
jgi:hypothetical protein